MRKEFSLIEMFGTLPVDPKVFEKLDSKTKWLGKCIEGDAWCVSCGTLNPSSPRSHHINCCWYSDKDEHEPYVNPIGNCPKCDSDTISIDSCRELEISTISCNDCDFSFSENMPENELEEEFKNKQWEFLKLVRVD